MNSPYSGHNSIKDMFRGTLLITFFTSGPKVLASIFRYALSLSLSSYASIVDGDDRGAENRGATQETKEEQKVTRCVCVHGARQSRLM